MKVGIVLGYGTELNPSYREYLDFVGRNVTDVKKLVLSGGKTNPTCGYSEAEVMGIYLYSHYYGIDHWDILLEEDATNTIQNLLYSRIQVDALASVSEEKIQGIVVFCDKIRRFKVNYMGKRVFPYPVEVRWVEREHSIIKTLRQYLVATPLEILAFHLHWFWFRQSMKRAGH